MKRTIINILVFFVSIAFVLLCHYWTYKKAYIAGYKQALQELISGEMEVSYRNYVELDITRVKNLNYDSKGTERSTGECTR